MRESSRHTLDSTHNPFAESHWVSCLRENLTSSSYGEGLETDRATAQVPRQSLTRQLVFKRLKSLAQLGHVPKHEGRSSRAWLYGKLLVTLLAQKLIRIGRDISPSGYPLSVWGTM